MGDFMADIDLRIENWKKRLLDTGKRNRLINFRPTKRSNIKLIQPDLSSIYQKLVIKGLNLEFPHMEINEDDDDDEIIKSSGIIGGDIQTNKTLLKDQQATLRNLRYRSKTASEEQGVNILFATFGLLKWSEIESSDHYLLSPIILVPVKLILESVTSPFILTTLDDEIVVNPTLLHKLDNDFGISLPDFEAEDNDILGYLKSIRKLVKSNSWDVLDEVHLGLFSFLKINMYKDIDNNKDLIVDHFIMQALSGTKPIPSVPDNIQNFDHDKNIRPIDSYQVLDADSSQQDAILYAKKNISFVLQGPPGTGKSQTITNLIAESLAEGKKVLFVSEKVAALDVVYKRLNQVGLQDFCLTLHSHHANKKEVLQDLDKTLNLGKFVLNKNLLIDLSMLSKEREKLNRYNEELHTIINPLQRSIFEINGELAKLVGVKDVVFSLGNVKEISSDELNNFIFVLDGYSKTIGRMHEDYTSNPWRGCKLETLTHEMRHEIESKLKELIPNLEQLSDEIYTTNKTLELSREESVNSLQDLLQILQYASTSSLIPISWVFDEDVSSLIEMAGVYKKFDETYHETKKALQTNYHNGYFDISAENNLSNYKMFFEKTKTIYNPSRYPDQISVINNIDSNIKLLETIKRLISKINLIQDNLNNIIDTKKVRNFSDAFEFEKIINLLCENLKPTDIWFDLDQVSKLIRFQAEAKENFDTLSSVNKEILDIFETEIFDVDYRAILTRYKTEYNSILKVFKKAYRQDRKVIKAAAKNIDQKFKDNEIILILKSLRLINDKKTWISENREKLLRYFGDHYAGEDTDWMNLEKSINNFEIILKYYLCNPSIQTPKNTLLNFINSIDQVVQIKEEIRMLQLNAIFDNFNKEFIFSKPLETIDFEVLLNGTNHLLKLSNNFKNTYDEITKHELSHIPHEKKLENLHNLAKIQEISLKIEISKLELIEKYQEYYTGLSTNWNEIIKKLLWAASLKELIQKNSLSTEFIKKICEDKKDVDFAGQKYESIYSKLLSLNEILTWYLNLFDREQKLQDVEIRELINRIKSGVYNLLSLEEWLDFKVARTKCSEVGLNSFIKQVEKYRIHPTLIIDSFKKQFYRKWLDAVLPDYPTVKSFRRRSHEHTLSEFVKHDLKQMTIAQSRIREKLISGLPNLEVFTTASNELGILKKELGKKRKIKPIRKIFKEIPNLLLTIKPCMMMSPLSVSLYLESNKYLFDIVIFDEASQVCTEDAIGAIFRGKQVVIVGDSKQLPPTSFFSASLSDHDYDDIDDDENEDDDIDAYESILEEAVTVLPERTLRWHYRSRHEHLIAFSNAKIYRQQLITFPSFVEKKPDVGVEYIYVSDGVYDRSGKRNNLKEAVKVAELVFAHFKENPDRSLGVVTFSQAQQYAVEAAIRKMRFTDTSFEKFFSEDKQEPFFIKNLENVQGDERDSIIFSIGYAKDHQGVMHMSFGPLNKSGGFRRLNVAITRAKFNVKLVGSIQPTDISLDKTESEGVKMLRSYIEYAMYGPTILDNELKISSDVRFDSPFEESIYQFLVSNGYQVSTQVGCSGYRIDLAIKHPDLQGRYVLGVECDGASYHSARTARERDRLRQTVLEDMGWKIYRIWSTDWIKDPNSEGEKLLAVIKESILDYKETEYIKKKQTGNLTIKRSVIDTTKKNNFEIPIEVKIDKNNPYDFDYYEEINPYEIYRKLKSNSEDRYKGVILEIVKNESPINEMYLISRLARLNGGKRITNSLIGSIQYKIKFELSDLIERRDGFLWYKGQKSVKVKIPPNGIPSRKIEYISTEELSEAMFTIVKHSYSIEKYDLFMLTARVYGFNRTGKTISNCMERALGMLFEQNKVSVIEGIVSVNKS